MLEAAKTHPAKPKDDQRRFSKWLSIRKHPQQLKKELSSSCLQRLNQAWHNRSAQQIFFCLENESYFLLNATCFAIQFAFTLSTFPKAYLRMILEIIMICLNVLAICCRFIFFERKQESDEQQFSEIIKDHDKIKRNVKIYFIILIIINMLASVEIELQKDTSKEETNNYFTLHLTNEKGISMQGITTYSLTFLFSLTLIPHQLPEIDFQQLLPIQFLGFAYFQLRQNYIFSIFGVVTIINLIIKQKIIELFKSILT